MPALTSWTPLRSETIGTIRSRIDSNVNAGLDEADPRWQETTPGGFFFDHTQIMALEAEQLWDYASTEVPASFFLPFSWGIYLDRWGELLDVPRKPAVAATGSVTLTNSTKADIPVAAGLEVAAPATSPEDEPLTYTTTAAVTVPAEGTVGVRVVATAEGSAYDVTISAVSQITSPSSGLTVTNSEPISGGEDEELDEPYKERLLLEFQGSRGGGTRDDYIAESLALPSVGSVVVQPHWEGPNTVRVIIADPNNDPLGSGVVEAVQAFWDPPGEAGLGAGEAPIDAEVTVATVSAVNVAVAAKLILATGYSIEGGGGTVAVQEAVELAVREYFRTLKAGEKVQLHRVLAAIVSVTGVYDVEGSTLKLNGTAADFVVEPLQSAQLGTVTLS